MGFDDLPMGEVISYERFLFYLNQGREIEFVYNGIEYFISHTLEGRDVWIGQTKISEYIGELHEEIIENTKIDGVMLVDLIKQNQITINTVF